MRLPSAAAAAAIAAFLLSDEALAQPDGREEIARLGCAACHDDLAAAGLRAAPDLRRSVASIEPAFLERYLAAPHVAQPGGRMPDLMGALDDGERARAAAELAQFLRASSDGAERPAVPANEDGEMAAGRGDRLFHSIGCAMCHGPQGRAVDGALPDDLVSLAHVPAKYEPDGLAAFLLDPLAHRPAGLMPEMHLSRAEAIDLAAFLHASAAARPGRPPAPRPDLARAGEERFVAMGCARCHAGLVRDAGPGAGPARGDLDAGCLADRPPAGVPDYHLSDAERAELRAAAAVVSFPSGPGEEVDASLAALRCTACHARGDAAGVHPGLEGLLGTDEPELGEVASRPPSLDGVGAKLQRRWLERVLLDGASVRPYMHTRMPVFGAAAVGHLPALLEQADPAEPLTFEKPEGEAWNEAREAAREMLGTTSLGCVTCHDFNGKQGPSFQGIDLVTGPERLRERWFKEFLIAPTEKVPGVVMPQSWPGGVAVHDTLLGGDTDRQIAAIWHYLALGTSARDPRGIDMPRWEIDVEGAPRVYRGRSRVAGFRGIALGFPEGLHAAFDANNGALAALWRGDFLSVNWNGQGAGDFFPRSKAAELPRDLALLPAVPDGRPWPLRPVTTEEEPVNPDPTYPRRLGYRFRGYRLGPDGLPTLRYAMGDVSVEDRMVPVERDGRVLMRRVLTFASRAGRVPVTFRALAGEIETLAEGRHRLGPVTLSIAGAAPRLREIASGAELLLDLDALPGGTELVLLYDLAD